MSAMAVVHEVKSQDEGSQDECFDEAHDQSSSPRPKPAVTDAKNILQHGSFGCSKSTPSI
jgi:hypothetical protein